MEDFLFKTAVIKNPGKRVAFSIIVETLLCIFFKTGSKIIVHAEWTIERTIRDGILKYQIIEGGFIVPQIRSLDLIYEPEGYRLLYCSVKAKVFLEQVLPEKNCCFFDEGQIGEIPERYSPDIRFSTYPTDDRHEISDQIIFFKIDRIKKDLISAAEKFNFIPKEIFVILSFNFAFDQEISLSVQNRTLPIQSMISSRTKIALARKGLTY